MTYTFPTKTELGDNDSGNKVASGFTPNSLAITSHTVITAVIDAGTDNDTRVCRLELKPGATDAEIASIAQMIDTATYGNIREVKKTISVNATKDKPAIVEADKYVLLATYDVFFVDGRSTRAYIRIPYGNDASLGAVKTFLESPAIAGTPAGPGGTPAAVPGMWNFNPAQTSYKLLTIVKVKDKS